MANLSRCSSDLTSTFALAHVRALCSVATSLQPPALAPVLAQPLIGEPAPVVAAHTWPLCPRAAEHLGRARTPHAVVLIPFQTCTRACVATLSTSKRTSGRSPHTSRCCSNPISNLHPCLCGHFVHVQLGSHFPSRPSTRQPLVPPCQIPRAGRISKSLVSAAHWQTISSASRAHVVTLSTSSWRAPSDTQASSMWISARFAGLRFSHVVCMMRLSCMRYTIGGEEPRALRPVP